MNLIDRNGKVYIQNNSQDKLLRFMYSNIITRSLLGIIVSKPISDLGGKILSTKASAIAVKPFVNKNNINLSDYKKNKFNSYNDFFTREIKPDKRPINYNENHIISPCDSRVMVSEIDENSRFFIKNRPYTISQLLKDKKLNKKYLGGTILIFRLCVDDYHRYIYGVDGYKGNDRHIQGKYHTVNPIANDYYPIYKENTRDYTIIKTSNFGDVIQMEVGALLVGKINNHIKEATLVNRGEEKGYFSFGGSTIIMIYEKDKIEIDKDIVFNSQNYCETKVRLGEKIGEKKLSKRA